MISYDVVDPRVVDRYWESQWLIGGLEKTLREVTKCRFHDKIQPCPECNL